MFFGHIECGGQILQRIVLRQFSVVDQVGSVAMDQCTESQTILFAWVVVVDCVPKSETALALKHLLEPRMQFAHTYLEAEMEVLYVDILVWSGLALAPQQQALFGGHLFDGNVLDGETQDDRPDHAQRHFQVAVDDFLGTDRHQLHALGFDEVQRFVHVGDLRWRRQHLVVDVSVPESGERPNLNEMRSELPLSLCDVPCGIAFCRDRVLAEFRPK